MITPYIDKLEAKGPYEIVLSLMSLMHLFINILASHVSNQKMVETKRNY